MTTQTLYLIRGLPGSGKSTMARQLVADGRAARHFEADMWVNYSDKWTPSAAKIAHDICKQVTNNALRGGHSVAVANTFTQRWEMQPYLDMARKHGANVEIVTAAGDYGNIHGVPDHVVDAMRQRWWDLPEGFLPFRRGVFNK